MWWKSIINIEGGNTVIDINGSNLTRQDTEALLQALTTSINAILEHKPDHAVWTLTRLKDNIESNLKGDI